MLAQCTRSESCSCTADPGPNHRELIALNLTDPCSASAPVPAIHSSRRTPWRRLDPLPTHGRRYREDFGGQGTARWFGYSYSLITAMWSVGSAATGAAVEAVPLHCLITDCHFWPVSNWNAHVGSRAVRRRARAMLARPDRRRILMTRLRRAAKTCGPVPVLAVEASSPKVTSRTQCSWFPIFRWPRIQAASWSGRAWAAGSEVIA